MPPARDLGCDGLSVAVGEENARLAKQPAESMFDVLTLREALGIFVRAPGRLLRHERSSKPVASTTPSTVPIRASAVSPPRRLQPGPGRTTAGTESGHERGRIGGSVMTVRSWAPGKSRPVHPKARKARPLGRVFFRAPPPTSPARIPKPGDRGRAAISGFRSHLATLTLSANCRHQR